MMKYDSSHFYFWTFYDSLPELADAWKSRGLPKQSDALLEIKRRFQDDSRLDGGVDCNYDDTPLVCLVVDPDGNITDASLFFFSSYALENLTPEEERWREVLRDPDYDIYSDAEL